MDAGSAAAPETTTPGGADGGAVTLETPATLPRSDGVGRQGAEKEASCGAQRRDEAVTGEWKGRRGRSATRKRLRRADPAESASTASEGSGTGSPERRQQGNSMDPNQSNLPHGAEGFLGGGQFGGFEGGWSQSNIFGLQHDAAGCIPPPVQPSGPSAPVLQDLQGGAPGVPCRGRKKIMGTRIKLSNFCPYEDLCLVQSWFKVSSEPVPNMGLKKDRFWVQVLRQYNEKRGLYPERSVRSLQSRWDTIKTEVRKFLGYMADSPRDDPSGTSGVDKTRQAALTFAAVEQHHFAFMHCWELMKDEPKLLEMMHKGPQAADKDASAEHIHHKSNAVELDSTSFPRSEGLGCQGGDKEVTCGVTRGEEASTGETKGRQADPDESVSIGLDGSGTGCSEHQQQGSRIDPNESNLPDGAEGFFACGQFGGSEGAWSQSDIFELQHGAGGCIPSPVQPSGSSAQVPQEMEGGTPGVSCRGRKKILGTRIKLSNFSPLEDVCLVKSWLKISCDPEPILGLKKDRFWDRVLKQYNEKRSLLYPERSVKSLQSRWDTIKAEVRKFSRYMAEVLRVNPSGVSDADKKNQAALTFATIERHNFAFIHCWELLKDEPKWLEMKQKGPQSADKDAFAEHIPHDSNAIELDAEVSPPIPLVDKTPVGRDDANLACRKSTSSSTSASSSHYAASMPDLSIEKVSVQKEENEQNASHPVKMVTIEEEKLRLKREELELQRLTIEEEKLRLKREQLELQRLKEEKEEDERILSINLDNCTPALRLYYQIRQEEILEKVQARRRKQ